MDVENANCKLRVSKCTDMEILPIERPIKIEQEISGLQKLLEELHKVFTLDHVNVQDVQKLMAGYKSDPKDWRKYAKFDRFRYTRNLVDVGNGAFNIMIICWGPGHASAIHDHADSHCFMKILSGSLEEVRYDWPENVEPEIVQKLRTDKRRSHCCSKSVNELQETVSELDVDSSNDSCQSDSAEKSANGNGGDAISVSTQNGSTQNGCQDGDGEEYDTQKMDEIGRTRLEVNDVCYINDALGLHRMENPSHVDGTVSLHLYCPPFDSCRVFDARTGKPTEVKVTFWSMYGKKVKRVIEANNIADSQQ